MDTRTRSESQLQPVSDAVVESVQQDPLAQVLSLSELATRLQVSSQTIYDLRSQGRGPRGFRVGRELRFRLSEVDAWLARLEGADAERHPAETRP
jgi:excisionase family DNA binding protein